LQNIALKGQLRAGVTHDTECKRKDYGTNNYGTKNISNLAISKITIRLIHPPRRPRSDARIFRAAGFNSWL